MISILDRVRGLGHFLRLQGTSVSTSLTDALKGIRLSASQPPGGPDPTTIQHIGGRQRVHPVTRPAREGATEEPSPTPLASKVDQVAIQQAYTANLEAMRAIDSVLAAVTGGARRSP